VKILRRESEILKLLGRILLENEKLYLELHRYALDNPEYNCVEDWLKKIKGYFMKFNLWFTLKGAGGIAEAPNTKNPVEVPSWDHLLEGMKEHINKINENQLGLKVMGIRVERID
jgi:hypothetical protein